MLPRYPGTAKARFFQTRNAQKAGQPRRTLLCVLLLLTSLICMCVIHDYIHVYR